MTDRQSPRPVIDPRSVPAQAVGPGDGLLGYSRALGQALGLTKLGARVMELEPGCTGWPRHLHHANDELFIILEGEGSLDYGDAVYAVKAGDVVGAPAGPGTAHRLRNTSDQRLRYLAVSTMEEPEVLEYPDSGKVGVIAGSAPGGPKEARSLTAFFPAEADVDYWHGE